MNRNYEHLIKSIRHLQVLHRTFLDKGNFKNHKDHQMYVQTSENISKLFSLPDVEIYKQLYNPKNRQMILADIIEYIFLSRGLFFITEGSNQPSIKKAKRGFFIKAILYFVNMLMIYESLTVDNIIRKNFLKNLARKIPEVKNEDFFDDLYNFKGKVGLPQGESDADKKLNRYFDKILPKTAGGLWHELLVFIFLLRADLGYIVPLLLNQKLISLVDVIVPPDFLLITKEKDIYGIEVGIKKEIQSGAFSLKTNIPTATIDTINSRCSDRCPICKKWIQFCDKVINDYSNIDINLKNKTEIRCLQECKIFSREDILHGKCPHTKYSRKGTMRIKHQYTTGYHYHYKCVLKHLTDEERNNLIKAEDSTAIKTHYPYYAGLETLFKN